MFRPLVIVLSMAKKSLITMLVDQKKDASEYTQVKHQELG
jgi:hypothetical protein